MKVLLLLLLVGVYFTSVSTWGVHKTRSNKTAKGIRRSDLIHQRQATAHPVDPLHHPKAEAKLISTTHRTPTSRRSRLINPRFRPLAKSPKKNATHPHAADKGAAKETHRPRKGNRKGKARTTKSPIQSRKLLARNAQPRTSMSVIDAHYEAQIRAFFQQQDQQHQHGPVQTRSRVKTGLKRRK